MLLMLLIGWVVLLPAFVVAGLYVTSSVLGRRRAAARGYDDLFLEDEQASDAAARWTARGSQTDAERPVPGGVGRAPQSAPEAPESEPSPLAARY